MRLIETDSLIMRNTKTRKRKVDKDQSTIWLNLMKQWYQVASKDPSKMAFYDEGAHLDTKVASSGIIEYGGKRMFNYFKKRRIDM